MWNTVEEFKDWYVDEGFPFLPPQDSSIFRTNNASAVVLYRKGQFQVEMYIADPNSITPEHSHPGVESIIMYISGDGETTINSKSIEDPKPYWDMKNLDGSSVLFKQHIRLNSDDTHGLTTGPRGFAFFSIEKWPDTINPSSVAAHWNGPTTGDVHDSTIKRNDNK